MHNRFFLIILFLLTILFFVVKFVNSDRDDGIPLMVTHLANKALKAQNFRILIDSIDNVECSRKDKTPNTSIYFDYKDQDCTATAHYKDGSSSKICFIKDFNIAPTRDREKSLTLIVDFCSRNSELKISEKFKYDF